MLFFRREAKECIKAHDRETVFIQEGSPITSVTQAYAQGPTETPDKEAHAACCMLFPLVETSVAPAGGTAPSVHCQPNHEHCMPQQPHASITVFGGDTVDCFLPFLNLNVT